MWSILVRWRETPGNAANAVSFSSLKRAAGYFLSRSWIRDRNYGDRGDPAETEPVGGSLVSLVVNVVVSSALVRLYWSREIWWKTIRSSN